MKFTDRDRKPVALPVLRNNIPSRLKELGCAAWDYTWRVNDEGNGEWSKPPYQGESSKDPKTWHTFDEAYELYERLGLAGIYVALPLDCSITGSDLDDCVCDGMLTKEAQAIVDTLSTYKESSPSGTGVRLFNIGSKPGTSCKRPKEHTFEMYDHGRFMSITGQPLNGDVPGTLNDDPSVVTNAYELMFPGDVEKKAPKIHAPLDHAKASYGLTYPKSALTTAADVIQAAANDPLFATLFYGGDKRSYNNDDSSADEALCVKLFFYTGDNPALVEEVFNKSALGEREKWGRAGYRTLTLTSSREFWISKGHATYGIDEVAPRDTGPTTPDEAEVAEARERAIRILKDNDPMSPLVFFLTTFGTLHVGDEDTAEGGLLSTMQQNTSNSKGMPSSLFGESSMGKSQATRAELHLYPIDYWMITSFTDRALFYMDAQELKDGMTIFSDDVEISKGIEAVIKRATSFYQEVTTHKVPVQNRGGEFKTRTFTIPAHINWRLTSVDSQGSDQLLNRQMGYNVNETDAQDKAVLEFEKLKAKVGRIEFPVTPDVTVCREMIRHIKEDENGSPRLFNVAIPFVERIEWNDAKNRRNFPLFLSMIMGHAVLNFKQRVIVDDTIFATESDYQAAARLYNERGGFQKLHVTEREKQMLMHIAENRGELTTDELMEKMNLSGERIRQLGKRLETVPGFKIELRTVHEKGLDSNTSTQKNFYCYPHAVNLETFGSVVSLIPEKEEKE